MQDYFLESLKLQRIDFFLKLVAASECSDEEKGLALQWVSELTDELMAKNQNPRIQPLNGCHQLR